MDGKTLGVLVGMATLSGLVSAGAVQAKEVETHEGGAAQTVTGEVVDLACYLGHGARGAAHRDCAEKCIASGLPVGIKTADALYLVIGSEHSSANSQLASLAAKQVTAEGTVTERDGVRLLAIKKVTIRK
jgi:hypothetical protein